MVVHWTFQAASKQTQRICLETFYGCNTGLTCRTHLHPQPGLRFPLGTPATESHLLPLVNHRPHPPPLERRYALSAANIHNHARPACSRACIHSPDLQPGLCLPLCTSAMSHPLSLTNHCPDPPPLERQYALHCNVIPTVLHICPVPRTAASSPSRCPPPIARIQQLHPKPPVSAARDLHPMPGPRNRPYPARYAVCDTRAA